MAHRGRMEGPPSRWRHIGVCCTPFVACRSLMPRSSRNGGNLGHGFRFDSASLSSMYFSNLSGATGGFGGLLPNSPDGSARSDASGGRLRMVSSHGPKGQVEATYSPGYFRRFGSGDFHSLNHVALIFRDSVPLSQSGRLGPPSRRPDGFQPASVLAQSRMARSRRQTLHSKSYSTRC